MKRFTIFALCGLAAALIAPAAFAQTEDISVYSTGEGPSGAITTDDVDTYWTVEGPTGDLSAGDTGQTPSSSTYVTDSNPGTWISNNSSETPAQWISRDSYGYQNDFDGDYTYTEDFSMPTDFSDPVMDLQFTSDNEVLGIYLNGILIPGTSTATNGTSFEQLYPSLSTAIAVPESDFTTGANVLTVDTYNGIQSSGNPEGLYVDITNATYLQGSTPFVGGVTPEPSSLIALIAGCGLLGLVLFGRRTAALRIGDV